jgi:hypothetical protein
MKEILLLSMPSGFEWIWIVILLALYFIPAIISFYKKHKNTTAIVLLNFFLGWTLLGWVGALIWSVYKPSNNSKNKNSLYSPNDIQLKICPHCAENIKIEANKCKHCGEFLNV